MVPLPPEEITQLMQFIAVKAKNATSPLNISELCRQFKKITGSSLAIGTLKERIISIRHRIHKMHEFDRVTRVKMLFALGASIDMGFLIELKKVADVRVDDQQRITEYKQKDGKLELIASNLKLSMNQRVQRGKSIIQFLAEKSRTVDDPMPDIPLLREFKEKTGCPDSIRSLNQRYTRLRNTIYYLSEIDMKTRIKMMFVSNVQVTDFILKLLRNDAEVEVDEQGRITKYTANDGSLELEGDHSFSAMRKRATAIKRLSLAANSTKRMRAREVSGADPEESLKVEDDSAMDFDFNNAEDFDYDLPNNKKDLDHIPVEKKQILQSMPPPPTPDDIAQMMRFIAKKTKTVTSPMNIAELCRQFKEETESLVVLNTLCKRIEKRRLKIHEIDEFDMETKVKMMFALSAPIPAEFIIELKKEADVEVDDRQRIIKYKKRDGGLELSAKYLRVSMIQGEQRDKSIIQILIEKTKTVDTPMVDALFVEEFKDITGCVDSITSLQNRYRRVRNTIFELPGVNKNTKVKMMFISNANISDDILEKLRKHADVEVDEEKRITKYKANDGSLELEGDHSLSAKMETSRADIKRRWLAETSKGRKQARGVLEEDYVEESLKLEDNWSMNSDTNNAGDFNYALEPMEHIEKKKPEHLLEVKEEIPDESSTNIGGDHFFFDYDPPTYKENLEHTPEEKKPESLIEVKLEELVEPSTSNLEYNNEENLENFLIEPKPETFC